MRTAMDGLPPGPRFYELDTVAHCGHTTKGEFLRTLTATDPVIGWTLIRAIRNNAHVNVRAGMDWIRRASPVPMVGMDFDNGSEFLNWSVIAWCDEREIPVTRGRPYQHNDNAHVEQRNADWVRRHTFRYRYETDHELRLLNELHSLVMKRKNHLLPCVKGDRLDPHDLRADETHLRQAESPVPATPRRRRARAARRRTTDRRACEAEPGRDHPPHHPHPAAAHRARRRPHPRHPPRSLSHTDLSREASANRSRTY
ncbi:hypothetical protein QT381_15120 [Galbitalea sp. SE-J8]|uniref:hypothetical protein n=1 Tax=Galbitalea sp. SE-J8 TaxID=3054952 RepID=UPI00259CD048|nr:hypothetical protein [Galbitalea sp. SE-J8]MDM4764334.1 hypothetical protein [Galbitalea sp. SE-J8]